MSLYFFKCAYAVIFFSLLLTPPLKAQEEPQEEQAQQPNASDEGNTKEGETANTDPEANASDEGNTKEGETASTDAEARPEQGGGDLLAYIKGLTYDERFLLAKKPDGTVKADVGADDVKKGNPEKKEETAADGSITVCTRQTHNLTGASDSVAIVQPTQGVIYPGALIQVNSQLIDGKPMTVPDLKRGTLTLHVKLPGIGEDGAIKVEDPNESKVQAAIDKALETWMNKNESEESYKNASRSNFVSTESFSSDQMALKMGASVGYMAISASAGFGLSNSKEKRNISAVYKQIFYTVTFDPPNGFTADKFFDSSVTPDSAQSAFNNENPLGYVASVDYGRLIMFNMETDKAVSSMEAEAALKASVGAVTVGVEAAAKNAKVIENSKLTVVTLGGNAEKSSGANSAKSAADLQGIIQGKNAVFSKSNPGVPIGYTIKFAKDNKVALLGKTTDYVSEECSTLASRWIRVENTGAFAVRDFVLTYDLDSPARAEKCKANPNSCDKNNGAYKPDKEFHTGNGNLTRWDIPGNAINVKLFGNVVAGTDRIKWLDDPKGDFNMCYQTQGTTLSSSEFVKLLPGQGGCSK